LKQTDILIIGGGAIDEALESGDQTSSDCRLFTYGMTETLSHICSSSADSEHWLRNIIIRFLSVNCLYL
jgi:O-succinylbenzoic acid--CoA ligase